MKQQAQKKAVVHIITKLELGGAQKVCLSLVDGIAKSGIDTYLISGNKGTIAYKVQQMPNAFLLSTLRREVALSSIMVEIKNFFSIIRILRQLKRKHPSLIVHTHSTKAGLIGRWAALFAGVSMRIHTIHGYGFHAYQSRIVWFIIYLLELITSLITTHYICVSSEDVKTGIRLFPNFAKKHSIIRAAIDWQQFNLIERSTTLSCALGEPFIFGTVSSFTQPGKNIPDLLKAFHYVCQRNPLVRLEIIGGGILKKDTEKWILDHGEISDKIILHGWQEKIAPIMISWHAFVFSSLWEGLPCAIIEARMLKLPVLSYNTGGIHDVIINGENGFLYPQRDWQLLANGMLELIHNPQLYQKLCTYQDNLKHFNSAKMIKQHRKLYQSFL